MYVPVAQRNKPTTKTGYVPVAQRMQTENIPSPFAGELLSLGESSFRTQASTPQMTDFGTLDAVKTVSKSVGQGAARGYAATGQRVAQTLGLAKGDMVDPRTFFGTSPSAQRVGVAVFGKDKPFSASTEDVEFLEAFGADPKAAAGTGGSLTLLLSALDVTGLGGAGRGLSGAIKAIKTAKNADDALRIAKSIGLADDIAQQYANAFAKARTTQEAKAALEAAVKLQNTTKAVKPRAYMPVAERMAAPRIADESVQAADDISEDLHPLVAEARKYKSAEEFVTNQNGFKKTQVAADDSVMGRTLNLAKGDDTVQLSIRETPDAIFVNNIATKKTANLAEKSKGTGLGTKVVQDLKAYSDATGKKLVVPDITDSAKSYWERISFLKDDPSIVIDIDGRPYRPRNVKSYDPQLTDIWKKAQEGVQKQLPTPPGLPKLSSIQAKALTTDGTPLPRRTQGQISKTISRSIEPLSPMVTQRARESTLLKRKLQTQSVAARKGSFAGQKVGKAQAENIADIRQSKAVRREELKSLKGGIKLRAQKDAIINALKTDIRDTDRVKKMIVEHVKDALDPADRGKALTLLRDAKTHKDLTKAFSRINRWAEDAIKRDIKNEILKTQKSIMDSPSISIDYKARVKELMGDFELRGHREETLERLKKTQEFLQSELAKGNDIEIPRRVLKSLELLNRTPFDEITINQLKGLQAEMELLGELGRTKFRTIENVWEIQKSHILDEVARQAAEPITRNELIRPEIGERLTLTQKFRNLLTSTANQAGRIDKAISPMDTVFDLLDGGRGGYDGANFRMFKGQVDAGYGRYIGRKNALQDPVIELAKKHKLGDSNFERMGVVAAREQDGGMEKLIASGFTEDKVNAIKLTKEEQEVLDLMRETFDSQFPEIQDTMRRVYNQPVEKVKNYFSFMTDWKAMDESEVFQRFGSQAPEQYGAPRKNVEAGFAKSRVGGDQKIKVNAMDVFMQHTDNTSYLLELGETTKMLGEVAASPKYAELVGDVGQLMVREWLDVVSRKGGAAGAQQIAVLDTLRRNVGAGILGLKLSTIAIQPTSIIDGMGFIGVEYGSRGIKNFLTDKEWRTFITKMPEISDRLGGEFALRELATEDSWLAAAQQKGFIPLQKLDQYSAGMIAAGAYERKMAELGRAVDFTKYDPEALAYAQLAVRRTQSSGSFKDVPLAVSRGALTGNRSVDRAILQFQNFLLTRWSRIRHDAVRAGINTRDPKKAIPVFTAIIMSAIAASGIRLGVNKIQDFVTGREDEDSAPEDLTKSFMYEMTGNVPFLGTALSMAIYDGEMFPILDAPKGVVSGLNRVITSESAGAKLRGLTEFGGSVGALIGVPGSAQAEQFFRGALQEEKKPERGSGRLKTPPGLPELPSLKSNLPPPPKLPALSL